MSKRKHPKLPRKAKVRPEEQAFLNRWKNAKSSPSFFEKMDKDPLYNSTVKSRTNEDDTCSMGTHWGMGKPKRPPTS